MFHNNAEARKLLSISIGYSYNFVTSINNYRTKIVLYPYVSTKL
jgi:hypothetical protein